MAIALPVVSSKFPNMSGAASQGLAKPKSKSVGALWDTSTHDGRAVEGASVTWSLTAKGKLAIGAPEKLLQRLPPLESMGSNRRTNSSALPTMSQQVRAMLSHTGVRTNWRDRTNLRPQKQPLRASFPDLKVMQKVVEEQHVVVDTDEIDQEDHVGTSARSGSSPKSIVNSRVARRLFDAVKKSLEFELKCDKIRLIYSEARKRHQARSSVKDQGEQPSSPGKAGEVREILREVLKDVLFAVKVCGKAHKFIGIVKGLAEELSVKRSKVKATMQRSLSKPLALRVSHDMSSSREAQLSMTRKQSLEADSRWAALRLELSNVISAEKELSSWEAFRAESQGASGETCKTLAVGTADAEIAAVESEKDTDELEISFKEIEAV